MGTAAVSTPAGPEQWVVAVWLSIESPVGAMWGLACPLTTVATTVTLRGPELPKGKLMYSTLR